MGLREAVVAVVDDMEKHSKDTRDEVMANYVRMLRLILEANADNTPAQTGFPPGLDQKQNWNSMLARAEKQELARRSQNEEALGTSTVELRGTPGETSPVMVPIPTVMPTGAKTIVGGNVYVRKEDGHLHYSDQDTQTYRSVNK